MFDLKIAAIEPLMLFYRRLESSLSVPLRICNLYVVEIVMCSILLVLV